MSKFTEKHKELWLFIKFSFVGVSSTLIETLFFYFLQWVVFKDILEASFSHDNIWFKILDLAGMAEGGKGYVYANLISVVLGYVIAFTLNRKATFKSDANAALSAFLYILLVIFNIIVTTWVAVRMQFFFTAHNLQTFGEVVSKPGAALVATAWTYPYNKYIVHRHKKPKEPVQLDAEEITDTEEITETEAYEII